MPSFLLRARTAAVLLAVLVLLPACDSGGDGPPPPDEAPFAGILFSRPFGEPTAAEVAAVRTEWGARGTASSGAEAVAINGHRLTARTAIRSAGDAITVDYRSLTRPYKIEAIGDPRQLPARFAESQGGRLWTGLQQNYQIRFEVAQTKELQLAADPGFGTREARRMP